LLSDGGQIDVQVRTSRAGAVQLFIGAYDGKGSMLFEEYYKERPGESMTAALALGVARAMLLTATKLVPLPSTAKIGIYRKL
jgi:3-polyprenyl-4-hydroxybenzoate decarboxylase